MAEDDLLLDITDTADSPVFDAFFAGYGKAFILPEEMEDKAGFRACLDLNRGAEHQRLAALYGPFREICLVARDARDGAVVGGANLIALAGREGQAVTANLNYVYVDAGQRGKGRFRSLVAAVSRTAAGLFGAGRAFVFIEQNDPLALDEAAYARDTRFTGMDQFDRLRIWAKLGALLVDTDYVQPALSAGHDPVDSLVLSVLGAQGMASLPADLLRHHLAGFFGISVLKGQDLSRSPAALRQIAKLEDAQARGEAVRLLDIAPLLAGLGDPATVRRTAGAGARFRDLARGVKAEPLP